MPDFTRRGVLSALASTPASALGWTALRRGQNRKIDSENRKIASETFGAWLTGENQLPPVETDAFGFAVFHVAPDESSIHYWLVVADVENVEESHVHTTERPAGEIRGQIRRLGA